MPAPQTLAALRTLVAAWTPAARPDAVVASGVPGLDGPLGGGLPAGRLTELVAPAGTGGQTVLAHLLASARQARQRVALVDASDAFAPDAVGPDDLRHLVWVRARGLREALAAADVLVRDGNFSSVVLDLRDVPARDLDRTAATTWHRLHRVAERQPAAVLVLSGHPVVPAVRWRLHLARPLTLAAQREPRAQVAAALAPAVARGGHHAEEAAG